MLGQIEKAGSVFERGRRVVDGAGTDHDEEAVVGLGYASDGVAAATEDGFLRFFRLIGYQLSGVIKGGCWG